MIMLILLLVIILFVFCGDVHVVKVFGEHEIMKSMYDKLDISEDSKTVVLSTFPGGIEIWDIDSGLELKEDPGFGMDVAFGDGMFVVTSTVLPSYVYDGKDFEELFKFGNRSVSVSVNSEQKIIATGNKDGDIYSWNSESGDFVLEFEKEHNQSISTMDFSPTNSYLLASGSYDTTIKLWDITTGECFKTLEGHSDIVNAVSFHPLGRILASASNDRTIRIWDVDTGECIHTLEGHSMKVNSISFSPDGEYLASGGEIVVRLWDVKTGKCIFISDIEEGSVGSLKFTPNGDYLLTSNDEGYIKLWKY